MAENLPEGVALPGADVRLFHWSGMNSLTERLAASNRLLAVLFALEREGRGYHLIGHSHGGSVIWEALTTAHLMHENKTVYSAVKPYLRARRMIPERTPVRRRRMTLDGLGSDYQRMAPSLPLTGLRSWTTVGTPFLTHLPKRRPRVGGWPDRDYSLRRPHATNKWTDSALDALSLILGIACMVGTVLPFGYREKTLETRVVPADALGPYLAAGRVDVLAHRFGWRPPTGGMCFVVRCQATRLQGDYLCDLFRSEAC
ncbi:hypothetical protein ACTG9Q_32675 [Actinokineospora sp. 24-640]